ncbi:hypothetical protein Tco_1095624, partial [Tanacetum coccineum]
MLNKENYVPWSSRLLRYAKSRPNGKLIYNSIINGPYVRRMIPKPSDAARAVPVPETFHEQTDDELTKAEIKQMEADDQAIQTILLGLPEDIYAAVDCCETAQEIVIVVPGKANQNGNGNVLEARVEGNANGNNVNQISKHRHRALRVTKLPSMTQTDQLSSGKQIMSLNEEILNLNKQLSKEESTISSLQEEKKRLKSDFKIREDELLDKKTQLENKIMELDNILVKTGQSIQTMHILSPKPDSFYHSEHKMALGYQNPFYLKQAQQKQQSLYNGKVLLEKHDPPVVYDSEETLELAQENSLQNKLHDTIYENAKLRAQLFDKVSKQKNTTRGTSANTKLAKQSILGKQPSSSRPKLYVVTPLPKSTGFPKIGETNALSNKVTSNSVPSSQESNVVKNDNVLSPRIVRMNPFKASRVDNFVPSKHVKASVRTIPIIVSQPHFITTNDVNSKTNGFSPKDVKSTTRTRRPLPRKNPKNDK